MKRAGLVLLTIAIGMSAARAARAEDDTSSTRPAASSEAAPSKKNEKLSAFATQRPHAQGGERNLETGKVYKKGQFLPLNKPVQLALPLSNGRTKGSVDPVTSATRGPVSIPVRSSDTGPVSIPVRTATPPAEAAPSASAPALAPVEPAAPPPAQAARPQAQPGATPPKAQVAKAGFVERNLTTRAQVVDTVTQINGHLSRGEVEPAARLLAPLMAKGGTQGWRERGIVDNAYHAVMKNTLAAVRGKDPATVQQGLRALDNVRPQLGVWNRFRGWSAERGAIKDALKVARKGGKDVDLGTRYNNYLVAQERLGASSKDVGKAGRGLAKDADRASKDFAKAGRPAETAAARDLAVAVGGKPNDVKFDQRMVKAFDNHINNNLKLANEASRRGDTQTARAAVNQAIDAAGAMRAGRAGAGSWTAADARARGQIDTGKMTRMLGKGLELKSQNLTRMAGQLGNQGSFRQADRVLEAARSAASQGRGLDPGSSRFDRIERDSYKQEIHVRTRQASELAARGDAQGAARAISRVQSIQQQQGVKQGFFKSIFNGDRFTMNRLMKQQPVQQALARTGTGTGGAAAGRTSGGSGSMGSGAQMAVSQARYSQGGLSSRIAGGGAAGRPGGAMASLRPGPGAGAGPVGRMGR